MKKLLISIFAVTLLTTQVASAAWYDIFLPWTWFAKPTEVLTLGAPFNSFQRSIVPIDSTENLGTSTAPWDELHVNEICLTADCKTAWPAGGSGAAYPFTPTSNYNTNNQATTGIPWFQNGLNASSTSHFVNASTTNLSVDGNSVQYRTFVTMGASDANFITDGTADEVQCNAALAYLRDLGGGTLIIKKGTYNFAARCFTSVGNINVIGENKGAVKIIVGYTATNNQHGAISFSGFGASNPLKHVEIANITFDIAAFNTPAVSIIGNTGVATTSQDFYVHDIEVYNQGVDTGGSKGSISIVGTYTGVAGALKDVRISRATFRDNNAITAASGMWNRAILILSYDLENFTLDNSVFKELYGDSVQAFAGSSEPRLRKNWNFDSNEFIRTKLRDTGEIGMSDIGDGARLGFQGIKVTNNYFEDQTGMAQTDEKYHINIYNSVGFSVDNNDFFNSRLVLAPGYSDPVGNESFAWTFTNNRIVNAYETFDPDGHYTGIYDHNVFLNIQKCPVLHGYGVHTPSRYTNNMLSNVCTAPYSVSNAYYQAPFLLETGGNVIEGNTIYATSSTATMGYVFTEFYDTAAALNVVEPNVYRNNTILGTGAGTTTFYLADNFKHVIQNNSGLTETKIRNYVHNLVENTPSDLLTTDIVSGNYSSTTIPTDNLISFGGFVGIGTTSPYAQLSVVGATGVVAGKYTATSTTDTSNFEGNVAFETSGFSYVASTNRLGLGIAAPEVILHVSGSAVSPALSGSTAAGTTAFETTNDNGLYLGSYSGSPFGSWLQASNRLNLSTTYPIILNPNGGNIGIATTSPYAKLSVVGLVVASHFHATTTATSTFGGAIDVTEANATSTFAGGIDLSNGCFALDGVCISGGAGSSASSTLLTDNNTFTGRNTIKNTTGTTTLTTPTLFNNAVGQYLVGIIPGGDIGSGSAPVNHGGLIIDNTLNTLTPGFYLTSDQAGVPSNPMAIIRSTDDAYNQGLLWLLGNSTNTGGAAYGLKIQDGNPDLEFFESDQTAPAGKYEIDVNNDALRFNGRNLAENSYESMALFTRKAQNGQDDGGANFCMGCGFSGLGGSTFNLIGTTTQRMPRFTISSASTTASIGNVFTVLGNAGNVGIATTSPYARLSVVGEVVASHFTATTSRASTFPYASTTMVTGTKIQNLNGDMLTHQATYIVSSSTDNGHFTDIQAAIDALPSIGGKIFIRAGTYTPLDTNGPVGILINKSKVILEGEGNSTTIQCNGANVGTCMAIATSSSLSQIQINDLKILETNGANVGIGLDTGDTSNVTTNNLRIESFHIGQLFQDTTNTTFYNQHYNTLYFDNDICVMIAGTLANDNSWYDMRCRPKAGGGGPGVSIDNARGISLYSPDIEPATAAGIIGLYLSPSAREISVYNPWLENNATNTQIAAGARRINFFGGTITGDLSTAQIEDLSTTTCVYNINLNSQQRSYCGNNTGTTYYKQGIGTSTPTHAFSVTGTQILEGNFVIDGGNFVSLDDFDFYPAGQSTRALRVSDLNSAMSITALGTTHIGFPADFVGVGTTTPTRQFTVEASGASGTTAGPQIGFRQNQSTINTTTNSSLGEIYFTGADTAAGEEGVGAKIRGEAANPWNGTTNDYPTDLVFSTQPDGGAVGLTEALRIRHNGNIGVATSSPFGLFTVEQGTETYSALIGNQGSSTPSLTVLGVNGNGRVGVGTSSPFAQFAINPTAGNGSLPSFEIGSSTGSKFRVENTGSVGIGIGAGTILANKQLTIQGGGMNSLQGIAGVYINPNSANVEMSVENSGGTEGGIMPFGSTLYIGSWSNHNVYFRANNSDKMTLTTAGNLGIGSTTPFANLAVNPVAGAASNQFVVGSSTATNFKIDNSGRIFTPSLATAAGTPGSVCYDTTTEELTQNNALTCTVSDEDQKSPLKPLSFDALEMIMKLQPSAFTYNDNPDRLRYGFGAQSLQKIDPRLADGYDKDGVARSIDLPALIALNTKGIQELDAKVNSISSLAQGTKRAAEENWQWGVIGLLGLGLAYQQYQIRKLKK